MSGVKLLAELPERKFSFILWSCWTTGRPNPCTATNSSNLLLRTLTPCFSTSVNITQCVPTYKKKLIIQGLARAFSFSLHKLTRCALFSYRRLSDTVGRLSALSLWMYIIFRIPQLFCFPITPSPILPIIFYGLPITLPPLTPSWLLIGTANFS